MPNPDYEKMKNAKDLNPSTASQQAAKRMADEMKAAGFSGFRMDTKMSKGDAQKLKAMEGSVPASVQKMAAQKMKRKPPNS
jgi:hypothetical protein